MSFASRQSRITECGDAKAANVAALAAQEYGSKRGLHVCNVSQFQASNQRTPKIQQTAPGETQDRSDGQVQNIKQ